MIKDRRFGLTWGSVVLLLHLCLAPVAGAQTFVGTNAPGTGSSFAFDLPAGVTNLGLAISNSITTYSHLFLKRVAGASATTYDYVARLNNSSNSLNLEFPELSAPTNYSLYVHTPATSLTHGFAATLSTNRPDARLLAMPVTKDLLFSTSGVLTNGVTHYYRVDVPTNLPGWRIVLSSTAGTQDPDVRIQKGLPPTASSYFKQSVDRALDTIFLDAPEATNHTYFISVSLPTSPAGNATYTLAAELANIVELTWEPGATANPVAVHTNQSALGGDYFFKIITQNADSGVWRTRLDVQSGEGDLRLRKTSLPNSTTADFVSARTGSDGVALVQTGQYVTNQTWYAMITAQPGSSWSLFSGTLFVIPLASPGADNQGGTNTVITPEGLNFYRTTIDASTIAWHLDMGLSTNALYVRKGKTAHNFSTAYYDYTQPSHALLVPSYLVPETEYFVTVSGTPGEPFSLVSRQPLIVDLGFDSSTNLVVTNQGYAVYRVAVPPDQIGWQLDLSPSTGEPGVAVRQSAIASEHFNTGYSSRTNSLFETLTVVPPTLTDAAYYITVFGTPPFSATLANTRPLVTGIDFTFAVTNDLPGRQGWRFYRVSDFQQQLDALGWELMLSNFLPGTEITVRRNHLPGRWGVSTNFNKVTTTAHVDAASLKGFLQLPRHPADVWYIGINNTNQPLGAFALEGREIPHPLVALNPTMVTNTVAGQPAGMMRYWQIEVPTNALGLEARIMSTGAGGPQVVVARGMLPVDLRSILVNSNTWTPNTAMAWPIGAQAYYSTDWTGSTTDALGTNETGRFFFAGRGNPLEPGTYYIGVINASANTNEMNYSLLVRGLFEAGSFADLNFMGEVSGSTLLPHESRWHRVNVPPGSPSWKLRLSMSSGDGLLVLRPGGLPNYGAALTTLTSIGGCELQKTGNEHFVLLSKSPETNVPAGVYYVGVVGQGMNPTGTKSGSNTSSFTLTSEGPLALTTLGVVDPLGITHLKSDVNQEGGEIRGFRFSIPTNTPVIEVRLVDRTGNPRMVLRNDDNGAIPPDTYGYFGGWTATWSHDKVIRIPRPNAGTYTLLVQAAATSSVYSNATYQLDISAQPMEPLAFDGGVFTETNQYVDGWRYYQIAVPAGALGWDLRLTNVTSGDPEMVICRDQAPFNQATRTASGGSWSPYGATNWATGNQIAVDKDWTGYTLSAKGTNETGRVFTIGTGNPLEPGNYIVGIASGGTPGNATRLAYTLVSRGIGTNLAIPVQPLAFAGGMTNQAGLPPREPAFYSIEVPTNTPSWKIDLTATEGESMVVLRKGGLPNFGAAVTTNLTNLAGCKLQKLGDERFALMPAQPNFEIPAGVYYLAVVSEGMSPQNTRIGSDACSYVIQSRGVSAVMNLGTLGSYEPDIFAGVSLPGGAIGAYQFEVIPGTLAFGVQLLNRTGNPKMTLRAGPTLPRSTDPYGYQGGWTEDWQGTNLIQVSESSAGGTYSLVIHAAGLSSQYPDASGLLWIYPLVRPTNSIAFDGGKKQVAGHPVGEWMYWFTEVPTNALGWDLRLTNIYQGSPRLVVCRASFPSSLTSRLGNGSTWNWGSATNWPVGAQAAPGLDWTGRRYDTNGMDTTGTIFAAGMGSPLVPGQYIIGVSSASGTTDPMFYTLVSRGIGTEFAIPVQPLSPGVYSGTITNLPTREAAYFRAKVETNTPLWKLHLGCTEGEGLLVVRKDALPNVLPASNILASATGGGHKFQRTGDEHAIFGQTTSSEFVPPGDYYLAVIGEGRSPLPFGNVGGGGSSFFSLHSELPKQISQLGYLTPGESDLLATNTLTGGETAVYEFALTSSDAVFLRVTLEDSTGLPLLRLRGDEKTPLEALTYGQDGGYKGSWEGTNVVSVNSPTAGVYRVSVLANGNATNWPALTYTMRVKAELENLLPFDGGTATIADQTDAWKIFKVQVPANALGWDLRLLDTGGAPRMVIRRDDQPINLTSRNDLFAKTNWPTGAQIAPTTDWTGLNEADGISITGRVFQVGMGNPLEPGTYYIGITNLNRTNPAAYRIVSRGIGTGFSVPVNDLAFSGGMAGQTLPPREAAWYRVQVPTDVPAWKVALWFNQGDGLLVAQRDCLPNINVLGTNLTWGFTGGKKMQKPGDEHLLLLPDTREVERFLAPGVYYLGVVSEGLNPSNSFNRIGTGSSSFDLWSDGSLTPVALGTLGSADLLGQASLFGGECELWNFNVPPGVPVMKVWLEPTAGSPMMTLSTGSLSPAAALRYGTEGGATNRWFSTNTIFLPNPLATNYSLTVQAGTNGLNYPDATFKLHVQKVPITTLNFAALLNTNGFSHVAIDSMTDGEKLYYRVQVPEWLGGVPVIGWKLSLESIYGTAAIRVRRDAVPDDTGSGTSAYFIRQAVFVPDYLAPGTWYIEVKANGPTGFGLTSEPLELYRSAWQMPTLGAPVTTPGMPATGPLFGDTGISPSGVALPDDGGTDLEQDSIHYYAVNVPAENAGILRTKLEAISGNPNLYIRAFAPPTLSHTSTGEGGPLYDRALTNSIGTEYGNWAVLDGKTEMSLTAGSYYLAVHAAGGSHVRYRLQLSTGQVTDLAFDGGWLTAQTLAAGDWRYYRVALPVGMPSSWIVSFAEQQGDVTIYLRDTVPPGQGRSTTNYIDWGRDARNHGPYPSLTVAGDYALQVPPLRPGNTYYLGVRALSDASFTIASQPGEAPLILDGVIAFKGGYVTNQLAPGAVRRYRIDVPADARRWMHSSTHATSVRLCLDQGSMPTMTAADHWLSGAANSSLNRVLYGSSWPWLPGYMYYLAVTNTSTATQPFAFRMDGKDCSNDDIDNDGLPDCWELDNFGSVYTYGPDSDPDSDGIKNAQELMGGTDPMDPNSIALTAPFVNVDGKFGFHVVGPTNRTLKVQASGGLGSPVWTDKYIYQQITPVQQILIPMEPGNQSEFYRVILP